MKIEDKINILTSVALVTTTECANKTVYWYVSSMFKDSSTTIWMRKVYGAISSERNIVWEPTRHSQLFTRTNCDITNKHRHRSHGNSVSSAHSSVGSRCEVGRLPTARLLTLDSFKLLSTKFVMNANIFFNFFPCHK